MIDGRGNRRLNGDPLLLAGNGHHGHDLDRLARKNREVRMILEELGRSFVRFRFTMANAPSALLISSIPFADTFFVLSKRTAN